MRGLVDRIKESQLLERLLGGESVLVLLYGQRRTGKTYLLQHLLHGKPDVVFFMAEETSAKVMLERFVASAIQAGLLPAAASGGVTGWSSALSLTVSSAMALGRSLTLVFDEVQYLIAQEPAFTSMIQRIYDEHKDKMRLRLVLCGSAVGALQQLGEASQPLYGRFSSRMKLRPFGASEAALFVPSWSAVEAVRLYGAFGGLARHLAEVHEGESLAQNVCRSILGTSSALFDAPADMLRCERLSSFADASALLHAIAAGENRFGSIAARTGLTAARANYALKELCDLDVVLKQQRYGDRDGARFSRYLCADPFVAFWHRFVAPNRVSLLAAQPEKVWEIRIAPHLDSYLGRLFEQVVSQALMRGALENRLGLLDELAPFWSRDGATEIDLVGRFGKKLLFVECKWRPGGEVGVDVLTSLQGHVERSGLVRKQEWLPCIASAGHFSHALRQMESEGKILLLSVEQLLC